MLRKAKPLSGPNGRQNMRFDTSVSGTTIVSPGSDGSSSKSISLELQELEHGEVQVFLTHLRQSCLK